MSAHTHTHTHTQLSTDMKYAKLNVKEIDSKRTSKCAIGEFRKESCANVTLKEIE